MYKCFVSKRMRARLQSKEKVISWLAARLTFCIAGTALPDPLALPSYAQHKNRNN